jgi:hypothetical protein
MHKGFLGWQNLSSDVAFLRKRLNMVSDALHPKKHTVQDLTEHTIKSRWQLQDASNSADTQNGKPKEGKSC